MIFNLSDYVLGSVATFVFVLMVVWTLYWKGMALWKSARQNDKWWFIAFLVVNTLGILEILYIYVFSKRKKK